MSWMGRADNEDMHHVENHTNGAAGRPGQLGIRDALGPAFGLVGPSEATLSTVFGRPRPRNARPARH